MDSMLQPLAEAHRQAVIDIYNHHVDHGFASYREVRLPYEAFDRFLAISKGYPAYVNVWPDGEVDGFGFLHAWHSSECFQRTAEITYFFHPGATRQGSGSRLLARLLEEAVPLKIDRILASISSRNPASLAFHLKHGFAECGRFPQVGHKQGLDFDVVWMIKHL
jgi:phosphinothricin acetyltransferase